VVLWDGAKEAKGTVGGGGGGGGKEGGGGVFNHGADNRYGLYDMLDSLDTPPWYTHAQTPTRTSHMVHPLAKTLAEAMRGGSGDGSSSSSWETAFGHLHVTADTSRSGETAIHGVCRFVCVRARVCERETHTDLEHLHVTAYMSCSGETALHGLYTCVCLCMCGGTERDAMPPRVTLPKFSPIPMARLIHLCNDSSDLTQYVSYICV